MTLKEQAYAIIDSFTEKQLKGFVDLFAKPESDDERSDTDKNLAKLARTFLGSFDDLQLEKETQELIEKQCAEGYSKMSAFLYTYNFKVGEYKECLRITMTLLNEGYSIEYIAELAGKPVKEIERMVELLKMKQPEKCKGSIDLFVKSEPSGEDRSLETIIRSLAMDYIENYSSTRYREGINDQILGYLEYGHSYIMAHLYVYRRALIETETKFYGIMKLSEECRSIEEVLLILPISIEEGEKMVELLRAEKLLDNGV